MCPPPPDLRRAYLYADPAAHSLSPRMHAAAFAWAGLSGEYAAQRVRPAELASALEALRAPGVLGANLSLPHKEAALPLLDSLTDAARQIGAVNTVINQGGHLRGDNTDAPGLAQALADAGLVPAGTGEQRGALVVLGAGGAARAALHFAQTVWGGETYVVNRTRARAEELVQDWGTRSGAGEGGQPLSLNAAHAEEVPWERVGLIINSSSAGLNAPEESPLPGFDFGRLPGGAGVYDMVYKPLHTRLLRDAEAAGHPTSGGLGMLAHQARLAFTAWTGREVPVAVFLEALA